MLHANVVRLIYRYLYHLTVNDCEIDVVFVVLCSVGLIALAISHRLLFPWQFCATISRRLVGVFFSLLFLL